MMSKQGQVKKYFGADFAMKTHVCVAPITGTLVLIAFEFFYISFKFL